MYLPLEPDRSAMVEMSKLVHERVMDFVESLPSRPTS